MSSDLDVIKSIVEAFERSEWGEIDVRSGSLRIHLSAHAPASAGASLESSSSESSSESSSAESSSSESSSTVTGAGRDDGSVAGPLAGTLDPPPGRVSEARAVIPDGAHAVTSPSPGIFWRSPRPGAPPFADVGGGVEAGTTLAIVEVMKLMNHISSDVPGTVVGVFVENGARVDRGQALFAIQPAGRL